MNYILKKNVKIDYDNITSECDCSNLIEIDYNVLSLLRFTDFNYLSFMVNGDNSSKYSLKKENIYDGKFSNILNRFEPRFSKINDEGDFPKLNIRSSSLNSYVNFTLHPPIASSFDLFVSNPHGFSVSYQPDALKDIVFSDSIGLNDIHFNNDGNGNLLIYVKIGDAIVFDGGYAFFEDGISFSGSLFNLTGFSSGLTPDIFDGTSEIYDSVADSHFLTGYSDDTGSLILRADIYFLNDIHYFVNKFIVGGKSYSLLHGVPINGSDGNDTLRGFDINDITGLPYNDTLTGGAGEDSLNPGLGIDSVDGGRGTDTLSLDRSLVAADIVYNAVMAATDSGIVLNDGGTSIRNVERLILTTGSGNDTLFAASTTGAFTWTANEGNDRLVVDYSDRTVGFTAGPNALYFSIIADYQIETPDYINSVTGRNAAVAWGVDSVSVTGGSGNDLLSGIWGNDVLNGGAGNDTLDGREGNDTLTGGAGDDFVSAGYGLDVVDGGSRIDILSLDRSLVAADIVYNAVMAATDSGIVLNDGGTSIRNVERLILTTGSGNDTLFAASTTGAFTWTANEGNDRLVVDYSDRTVGFTAGPNALYFSIIADYQIETPDYINPVTGRNAAVAWGVDSVSVTGGSGNDLISGIWGNDVLNGGAGNDTLDGREGNDTLTGGAGDDFVSAGYGLDVVDGGSGIDILSLDRSLVATDIVYDAVVAATDAGIVLNDGGASIRNVERLILTTGSGNDTLFAASTTGAFTWTANEGNDRLVVDYSDRTVGFTAGPNALYFSIIADYQIETPDYINSVTGRNAAVAWGVDSVSVTGGSGNDLLSGIWGNDVLNGGAGNDTLDGREGNNTLTGGAGDDFVSAGYGLDVVDGGSGIDILSLDCSLVATDIVYDAVVAATDAGIVLNDGGASIRNVERLILTTGSGNDTLFAASTTGAFTWTANEGNDRLVVDYSDRTVGFIAGPNALYFSIIADYQIETPDYINSVTGRNAAVAWGVDSVSVTGGSGNDLISGIWGNDVLNGGAGNDTLTGGAGDDSYYVDNAGDAVMELHGEGRDIVYASVSFGLGADIENLELVDDAGNINATGNALGNWLVGNEGDNVLSGGDGSDILIGNGDYAGSTYLTTAGADTLLGGEGNDGLFGGGSAGHLATLDAGNGDDGVVSGAYSLLDGGAGSDLLTVILTDYGVTSGLGAMLDVSGVPVGGVVNLASGGQIRNFETFDITGTSFGDSLIDGNGNGILRGAEGSDRLEGRGGNDRLDGGTGDDTLVGGLGDDTFVVDSAADVVTESNGQGTDTILASVSYALGATYVEVLTLTGTANIDAKGNTVNNALNGNSGNNRLDGGIGTDTLTGGLGDDTYVVDNAGDVVVELVGQGVDTLQTVFTTTLTAAIENLVLTGTTAINGAGNASDNSLTGNFGANSLTGLGGNDRLDGGGGTDTLIGGLGNDTYVVDNAGDVVTELNGQGADTVLSSVSFVLSNALSIETLTLTGPQHINATGNAFANALNGNSGNNTLNGGSGADTLVGGLGHDIYVVENVGDVVIEGVNAGTDTVQSAVTYVLGDNVENLTLAGSGAINGTGNDLANIIYGNAGANVLNGMGGIDKLYGRGGNDTYIIDTAGTGASELLGGTDAGGVDEVRASVSFNLGFYIENLILTGSGNIAGGGNDLANTITGNGGDNILKGRLGNDTLSGGLGADQFVFEASAGKDRVTDFSAAQNDKINVHALAHGVVGGAGIALSQVGGDTVVDLGGGNMVTIVGAVLADVQSHIVW